VPEQPGLSVPLWITALAATLALVLPGVLWVRRQ
jgi:hypothetical protein